MEEVNQPFDLEFPLNCNIKHIPIKRIFDIFFSISVLILGFPVFFLIALLIRLTSRGRIIYSHERLGRGGKPFRCYKFRTMRKDADAKLKAILESDHALREEWARTRKLKCDPRVTWIGHFLRKTSLDEIPQFWNVLKGDLSVVGPRPVVKAELDKYYGIKREKILAMRPGLTCLWQVSGRSDVSYEKRVKLDEDYIDNQSFWLDLKLIAQTIPAMLFTKGAY